MPQRFPHLVPLNISMQVDSSSNIVKHRNNGLSNLKASSICRYNEIDVFSDTVFCRNSTSSKRCLSISCQQSSGRRLGMNENISIPANVREYFHRSDVSKRLSGMLNGYHSLPMYGMSHPYHVALQSDWVFEVGRFTFCPTQHADLYSEYFFPEAQEFWLYFRNSNDFMVLIEVSGTESGGDEVAPSNDSQHAVSTIRSGRHLSCSSDGYDDTVPTMRSGGHLSCSSDCSKDTVPTMRSGGHHSCSSESSRDTVPTMRSGGHLSCSLDSSKDTVPTMRSGGHLSCSSDSSKDTVPTMRSGGHLSCSSDSSKDTVLTMRSGGHLSCSSDSSKDTVPMMRSGGHLSCSSDSSKDSVPMMRSSGHLSCLSDSSKDTVPTMRSGGHQSCSHDVLKMFWCLTVRNLPNGFNFMERIRAAGSKKFHVQDLYFLGKF